MKTDWGGIIIFSGVAKQVKAHTKIPERVQTENEETTITLRRCNCLYLFHPFNINNYYSIFKQIISANTKICFINKA